MFQLIEGREVMLMLMTVLEYTDIGTSAPSAAVEYLDTGELA